MYRHAEGHGAVVRPLAELERELVEDLALEARGPRRRAERAVLVLPPGHEGQPRGVEAAAPRAAPSQCLVYCGETLPSSHFQS